MRPINTSPMCSHMSSRLRIPYFGQPTFRARAHGPIRFSCRRWKRAPNKSGASSWLQRRWHSSSWIFFTCTSFSESTNKILKETSICSFSTTAMSSACCCATWFTMPSISGWQVRCLSRCIATSVSIVPPPSFGWIRPLYFYLPFWRPRSEI